MEGAGGRITSSALRPRGKKPGDAADVGWRSGGQTEARGPPVAR